MAAGFKITRIVDETQRVMRYIEPKQRRVLFRIGAFVMTTARRSIRPAGKKNKSSSAGDPPKGHTKLLRRNIFYGVDTAQRSVVVGPVVMPSAASRGAVDLAALEHGGSIVVTNTSDRKRTRKKVSIEERPFMRPALAKEATPEKISSIWKSA